MPVFDRFKPSIARSFALRTFNRYETEINQHFWSFKVVSDYARFLAQQQNLTAPTFPTSQIFHATGPDARRIPPNVSDWLNARKELENWLRLSALVSAAAYHEAYLRQIIRSALMADPFARQGAHKTIDGTILLKKGVEIKSTYEISLMTRGDWPTRYSHFERIFGKPPAAAFPIAALEEIRKARNDFAHGFGRDLNVPEPSMLVVAPALRLSQTRFIKFIGVLSTSATAIDRYMMSDFMGDFELVHAYHAWTTQAGPLRGTRDREFQKYIHGKLGSSKSRDFCRELIAYYDGI